MAGNLEKDALNGEKMTAEPRKLPEWMALEEIKKDEKQQKVSCIKKNALEDRLPFLDFPGSIIFSYEANDCSFLSEDLRSSVPKESAIGFDMEWPPTYIKGKVGKVALIQLCASVNKCYLFHISSMSGFPSGLKRLLEDEAVKKVGVGIDGDHWKLMRDYDIKLKGFVELTDVANQKLKCAETWSLNGLVKHLCGKKLWKDESIRCSNWDIFPLSDQQQRYAATDAYAGFLIYEKLNSLDIRRGKLFLNKNDPNLPPSLDLRSNLTSVACEMQKLAELVPDSFISGVQRATNILSVISENVSSLKTILLESTPGTIVELGKEAKSELHTDNQAANDQSENSLEDVHNTSGSYQEVEQESNLTDSPLDPHNSSVACVTYSKPQGIDKNESDVCAESNQNKHEDYLMSLPISEYELQMLEQQAEAEDAVENAISSLPIKAPNADEEADLSYVIESDEELENEMLKALQDLDNCSGMETQESLKDLSDQFDASEKFCGVEDEEDESIKEEEDKWDASIPEPNAKQIKCLKTYFGHSNFKPVQWKVIYSVLQERRDNLVVMATGYGKSLCYQFPAIYTGGVTIVISPLISLMEDQVLQLNMSNVAACFLGSSQSKNLSHELTKGHFKVIYMTPEFCSGSISLLKRLDDSVGITLVAVDEAHCISEWGHDFRNSYRKLGALKSFLPQTPVVALTATASPSIRDDIIESLMLKNPRIVCTTFDRPNLYLEVGWKSTDIQQDLKPLLIKRDEFTFEFEGPTIVYCPSRKATELVAAELSRMNIACGTYHAGMGIKARRDVHHKFMRDEIQCVVATIAFGMGINKPDIRKVIHYGAPKEMESYYQQIGRAGRDGLPSTCHVLWSPADMVLNRRLLSEIKSPTFRAYKIKMMEKIKKYLTSSKCRRNIILSHFEDEQLRRATLGIIGTDRCCDNCRLRIGSYVSADDPESEMQDFGKEAHQLLSAVCVLGEIFGIGVPVLFLRGSRSQRLPERHRNHHLFGSGKNHPENWWKALGQQLTTEGFLRESSSFSQFAIKCTLTNKGRTWLSKASDESCRTLLLQATKQLCPPVPFKAKVQPPTSSSVSSQQSSSLTSQLELQKVPLRDWFERKKGKENEKLLSASAVKSRIFVPPSSGSPVKPIPAERVISPRELELQGKLYGKLVAARQKIAIERDVPPVILATNKILLEFTMIRPTTSDNMKRIDGVSEGKSPVLAPLLNTIKEFCQANELEMDRFSVSSHGVKQQPVFQLSSTFKPVSDVALSTLFHTKIGDSSNVALPVVGRHLANAPKSSHSMDVNQARLSHPVQELNINTTPNPPVTSDLESVEKQHDGEHMGQPQSSCIETKSPLPRTTTPDLKEEELTWIETAGKHTSSCQKVQSSVSSLSLVSWKQPDAGTKDLFDDSHTEGKDADTEKPAVTSSSQPADRSQSVQRSVSSISLASWNQPMIDTSVADLFDDSQTEACSQSIKRKLPDWFDSSNPEKISCTTKKKVKKGKGLFN
ncbi:Werner syndrome ATP-dependent helicase homolog isoform X2 [Carcharodon carcharias]|uniref:Werner syndrome ATP-dependent helicase homolog isoform X2 n=1 Tax=Carcharodon carcharias TaxID=13397 RepID=UPI001B7EBA49|nr:Werner syndrome ATP-dependent helicase homolog isoform X2 [Carcharodon carcharias]XP_041033690.1 Werner syndrome ATP-dependent helicase homolog isoform X2 [Carcharodon carcharias]